MHNTIPLTRIQRLIGERMLQSKHSIPSHYIAKSVNTESINRFRREYGKQTGCRVSTNDIFFAAIARAAEKYPLILGTLENDKIKIAKSIDISFAVAGKDDILVVPVIRAAEKLSLTEIAEKSASLTKKGKEGSLRPDDMNNATIALSSLAMFGVNSFIAIPPADSNAIISVGRPEAKISIVDGKPVSEKFMSFCISANARVVSSFYCAKFLAEFARLVENPQLLVD